MINSLLGVVGGIRENPGVCTALDPIRALHHDPIFHCIGEIIIKDVCPDGVHQLSATLCQNVLLLRLPVHVVLRNPIMKCVGELRM